MPLDPITQQKFLLIRIALARLNIHQRARPLIRVLMATIYPRGHSLERQRSRSIPKYTPKCKRLMLHAHSSLYLPPHNYTPCIKNSLFCLKKKNYES